MFRCFCGVTWPYNYRLFVEYNPNPHRRYGSWVEIPDGEVHPEYVEIRPEHGGCWPSEKDFTELLPSDLHRKW